MSMLDRKLVRELGQTKGQTLAIVMVVASGVAVFVMALGVLSFLQSTRDAFYDRYRFADVFAPLVRAPLPVATQIESIPGVARVQTRVVADVTLDVPNLAEPAVGRLISIPEIGAPVLNAVHLVRGRLPDSQRAGEVLAAQAFVDANRLELGDTVAAIINGRYQRLRIVGVALSPEYVFQIRAGDLLPDNRRFGVFWMRRDGLEAAFNMDGAFNDVSIQLMRGASVDEVIDRVDAVLDPYGGIGAISREDQISARFLSDEIRQLRATGVVAPVIFLGVAAFLLNVVLARKITGDRESIAALRAFGYTATEIGAHYLKTSLLIAMLGAVAGTIAGSAMGSGLSSLYAEFYRFPDFVYRSDWRVALAATVLSLGAAGVGAWRSVLGVVRMQPAEAMRPPAPPRFRPTLVERLGLASVLPLMGRMILRQMGRRPVSAVLASVGIACAVAVMVLSSFAPDAINYLLQFQFELAQRQGIQVVLEEIRPSDAVYDFQHLPGVLAVEPMRAVAVEISRGHRSHRTAILGLGQRRDLYRLLDTQGRPIRVPPGGVVLSDRLAQILRVEAGQTVVVDVLEGERPRREIHVSGIVSELAGTNAYMQLDVLHRLMEETDVVSGVYLSVDPAQLDPLYAELKQTPEVASVSVRKATMDQFRETIAQNTLQMQSFTMFFAAVIAVGVVYNTARISLDERARELSTLRVIGFSRTEISMLLLGELAVLTLMAIPIGWGMGYGFTLAMVRAFESDMFRIPLVIEPSSYAKAALVTIVAAAASGLLVRRRLDRLDLVEVLKSRS